MHRIGSIAALLTLVARVVFAQAQVTTPGPMGVPQQIIADADHFQAPRLTEYAAKLARQPDMSGLWSII